MKHAFLVLQCHNFSTGPSWNNPKKRYVHPQQALLSPILMLAHISAHLLLHHVPLVLLSGVCTLLDKQSSANPNSRPEHAVSKKKEAGNSMQHSETAECGELDSLQAAVGSLGASFDTPVLCSASHAAVISKTAHRRFE